MTGEVTDTSGAVVPGAVVTVTSMATNISVKTEANAAGVFTVASLRPGEYVITVESAGFNRTVRSGITLQVAQTARVDLTLQAGQVSEVVEVTAAASLLESQTSSRGLASIRRKSSNCR